MAYSNPELPASADAARTAGSTRYFTGKPCKRGHIGPRYTAGKNCCECSNRSSRESTRRNYEKYEPNRKAYREQNREAYRVRDAEYYLNNKERILEKSKINSKKNPTLPDTRKAWWANNPDKDREYRKKYRTERPWDYAYRNAVRRQVCRQASAPFMTPEVRKELRLVYKHCNYISRLTDEPHNVDHIVPLRGENVCGLHVPWNLQIISRAENIAKNNRFEVG